MITFAPMNITVHGMKFNSVDHSAAVNIGPTQHIDFFISYKRNQGIGEQNGDLSPIVLTFSLVSDSDLIDTAALKNSII